MTIHCTITASLATMASLMNASPSWWGYTSAHDPDRIDRLISRLKRGGWKSTWKSIICRTSRKSRQTAF